MRHYLLITTAGGIALLSYPAIAQTSPTAAPAPSARETSGAWGVDLSARDLSVKPGDDFDRYANGTWADKTEIPADQPSAGAFVDVYNRCQDQLRSLVEGSARTTQIGGLSGSFMDEARVETLGAKPLETDLTKIAAVENKEDFAKVMGRALSGFGAPLYGLVVMPDPKRPDLNVLWIAQAGLGLPDRDYYLIPTFKPQLDAYRAFVERALTMIRYADPSGSAAAVIDLETRIARASWRSEESRDIEKINNPMSLSELKTYTAGFPWEPYLSAAGVSNPGKMLVAQNSAIKAIAGVYAETPLPVWKAWEAFHTVSEASPYLSKAFVDSDFVFTKALSGVSTLRPRWKRGVALVDGSLGEAVGHAYVDRYFPPASKAAMQEMIGHLKKAMGSRIRGSTWMSPSTKEQALTKLDRMEVMVGYPDKWRDYSGLKVDPTDLYGNVEHSVAFEWLYGLSDLGKPVDRKKWDMTPQRADAYNGGFENKIVFPAGLLQAPFFNPSADPAVNYGSIGAIIGHEISHGFDDQGRKIDASGALRDWWTPDDAKHFEAQAERFGKQYDSYEPVPGMHINGKLTMGENIADLAGVLVALDAYHDSWKGAPPPVVDQLTGDQRFFLAFAQIYRAKEREDATRARIASDPHSPKKYRIIGPLRNVDAWYDAFNVPATAKYYLKREERTRIW